MTIQHATDFTFQGLLQAEGVGILPKRVVAQLTASEWNGKRWITL